jgi:hypothetical protein
MARLGFVRQGQSSEATIHRKIIGTIRPNAFLGDFSGGLSAWIWLYPCQKIGFGYFYGNIVLCVLWPFPCACGQLQHEHADRVVKLRAIRSRTRPYPPRPHPRYARFLLYAPANKRDMSQLF